MKRVAITGLGVVANLGSGVEKFWETLLRGESLGQAPEFFDPSAYRASRTLAMAPQTYAALRESRQFPETMSLYARLGCRAAEEAVGQSGLDFSDPRLNAGCFLGTTTFGIFDRRTFHAGNNFFDWLVKSIQPAMDSDIRRMAEHLKLTGPLSVFSSACTSGLMSIAGAADHIASGRSRAMLAGGVDIIQELAFAGFNALRLVSKELCRPFDANRKGILIGEGAAVVVLEDYENAQARGARILAEVKGIGLSCDGQHVTAPNALGAAQAMRRALDDAGMAPEAIDYINCHGTGTMLNDKAEMEAIDAVFSNCREMLANSTKAVTGHWLGTAGSIEFIIAVLALKEQIVPPAMNIETLDPGVHFKVNRQAAVRKSLQAVMTNAFGFGGNNSSVILTAA